MIKLNSMLVDDFLQQAKSVSPHHLPPMDRAVIGIKEPDIALLLEIEEPAGS